MRLQVLTAVLLELSLMYYAVSAGTVPLLHDVAAAD